MKDCGCELQQLYCHHEKSTLIKAYTLVLPVWIFVSCFVNIYGVLVHCNFLEHMKLRNVLYYDSSCKGSNLIGIN